MSKSIAHVTDDTFQVDVLQSELPVLVDFWATWCAPCLAIAPHLEALSQVYAGKIKIVKLDVDENPKVATQYQVRSIPTLIIFHQGKVLSQRVGSGAKAALETFMQEAIQKL